MKRAGAMGLTALTAGSTASGLAAADETVTLTGYVYHGDEAHSPIPEFSMVMSGPERYETELDRTDKDYYNFKVVPGEYSVFVNADGYEYAIESVTVESGGLQKRNFVLDPVDSGTVTGTVVDADGNPVDSGSVSLDPDGDTYPLSTSIGSNGEFEIELQEGEWDVTPDLLEYEGDTETVSITEDETAELDLEVAANENGRLHILLEVDGELPETDITLIPSDPSRRTDDSYERAHLDTGETHAVVTAEAGMYDVAIEPGAGYASDIVDDVEVAAGTDNFLSHELEES